MSDSEFQKGVIYYRDKCTQHLNRVLLSHRLAIESVRRGEMPQDKEYVNLITGSFAEPNTRRTSEKIAAVVNDLHLVSLKTNFELFLNRLLFILWKYHQFESPAYFQEYAIKVPAKLVFRENELTEADRDSIIDEVIPNQGLDRLREEIRRATCIDLMSKAGDCWSQIRTAFEIRHLLEHRRGKIDGRFRKAVRLCWAKSSFAKHNDVNGTTRVVIEEDDIKKTFSAMVRATELFSQSILDWSKTKAPTVKGYSA